MRRRGIEVVVELLHVLAVIALAVGQAEQALLENRILPVPKRQGETKPLLIVADAGDAVFAPAIGAAAGVVVREILPSVAIRTVILADGSPLAFGQIRSPQPPGRGPVVFVAEMFLLYVHGDWWLNRELVKLRSVIGSRVSDWLHAGEVGVTVAVIWFPNSCEV